ncbi:Crp/Fnr family transcriptional regulator [Desulfitibacter alkalitolerans]|uniref:Crp/Fnr family transcriptional regulator n=1 Tax=Desulfitibacter alkalitolerans TaxID=264641 RepID=UPI00048846A7|nr:Crp/Fnr family transcriptional regulator [Desulfitibacter alkalitolerans]
MAPELKCMKDLAIFEPLDEKEKELITLLAKPRFYTKGEIIFAENSPADTIYFIRGGKILLYKISEEGKEMSLDILQKDDVFGENTIFDDALYTMNAKALEHSYVCTCTRTDFLEMLKNPVISLKMLKALGDKLNNYTEQLAAMAFNDVKTRILSTLERLSKEYGKNTPQGIMIDIPLNHQDLACLVNASRVMVTNTLSSLKQDGRITVHGRRFHLLD